MWQMIGTGIESESRTLSCSEFGSQPGRVSALDAVGAPVARSTQRDQIFKRFIKHVFIREMVNIRHRLSATADSATPINYHHSLRTPFERAEVLLIQIVPRVGPPVRTPWSDCGRHIMGRFNKGEATTRLLD